MQFIDQIIRRLSEYVNRPVILNNQAAPKPSYPYIGITETAPYVPATGFPIIENEPMPEDINQIAITQPTFTLSITAYGRDFGGTTELIKKTHGWFSFTGKGTLKGMGLVVQNLGAIDNRDTLIVDDYERRRGFDVSLRFVHRQVRFMEEIKTVSGTVNDIPFEGVRT